VLVKFKLVVTDISPILTVGATVNIVVPTNAQFTPETCVYV
jgi:hypothetical protein